MNKIYSKINQNTIEELRLII